MADINNAIAQRSFSAMYPDDKDSTTTPSNPVLSVITPLVDKYLDDIDTVTDQLPSEPRNLSIDLEDTNHTGYHSSYITQNPLYKSNPILKELYSKFFNEHFLNFYDYLMDYK